MNRITIAALRVLIAILFLCGLVGQVYIIPIAATSIAELNPELAYLAAPYAALWVTVVACVQVVFFALWSLLSRVRHDAIFAKRAFLWVDGIIAATAIATVLVLGFGIDVLFVEKLGPGSIALAVLGAATMGITFMLLMVVMRGLLRSATSLRAEMDEVV